MHCFAFLLQLPPLVKATFAESPLGAADWWVAWATVALALVTLGLAIYTGLLFREAKLARRDAKQSLDIATKDAEAAVKSVEFARESMVRNLRAYITVENVHADIGNHARSGRLYSFNIVILNTGQTPARDVTVKYAHLLNNDNPNASTLANCKLHSHFAGTLGKEHHEIARLQMDSNDNPTLDHWWSNAETVTMVIFGEIRYRDMLTDEEHITQFCYKFQPGPQFYPYGPFNTIS